jgi:uncharacterized membrane protein YfcA
MNDMVFLIGIALVAFLYSSVGHGGATGYIFILMLAGLNVIEMRSSILVLNVLVSGIAFIAFYRAGYFDLRKFFPFIIFSIPAAFAGSFITINMTIIRIFLAFVISLWIIRIIISIKKTNFETRPAPRFSAWATGGIIGLISGMTGIGGGVLLTPVLILFRWTSLKEASCLAALFILVNSLAGLTGNMINAIHLSGLLLYSIPPALIGGMTGSWLGARHFSFSAIKYVVIFILLIACCKLFLVS